MSKVAIIWDDIGHYHAERIIALQSENNIQPHIIEIKGKPGFDSFRASADRLKKINLVNLELNNKTSTLQSKRKIERELDRISPAVVFTPGWSTRNDFIVIRWCLRHRIPFVIMSDSTYLDKERYKLVEFFKSCIVMLASGMFVAGSAHASYAEKLGMNKDRIALGYDVVDNYHFYVGSTEARNNKNFYRVKYSLPDRYLLCCARFVEKKNHIKLLKAFLLYKNSNRSENIHLVLVGNGILEDDIRSFVDNNNMNAFVHFKGFQSYDDLPILYGLADGLVLASTEEQWGLVVNEAMACGLPILLSSHCGCAVDLVKDGDNGFIFDPNDTMSIYNCICKLFVSDTNRESMSQNSRYIISKWNLQRFVDGFRACLSFTVLSPNKLKSILGKALVSVLAYK